MKIFVINPNTSEKITENLKDVLNKVKREDCELTVDSPIHGPVSIESAYDDVISSYNIMNMVEKANKDGFDAIIIACFSDPGLDAAKEISRIPVIGIEEATLHMASMLGNRFSIMTGTRNRIPTRDWHVTLRGVSAFYASSIALEMSVVEMNNNPEKAKKTYY